MLELTESHMHVTDIGAVNLPSAEFAAASKLST